MINTGSYKTALLTPVSTTSINDILTSPAVFRLLDALTSKDVHEFRLISRYARASIDAVLPPIMFVHANVPGSRYPVLARPPKRILWDESSMPRRFDRLDRDSGWLSTVEEMWGNVPGMCQMLRDFYGPCEVLPLDRLKTLVAKDDELINQYDVALSLPGLEYIRLIVSGWHPHADVLLRIGASRLSVLDLFVESDQGVECALKHVAAVIRSARHTLKRLRIGFHEYMYNNALYNNDDLFPDIMDAIGCCESLDELDLSGIASVFRISHANKLPPSVREVVANSIDLTDWDFPRPATVVPYHPPQRDGFYAPRECVRCLPRLSRPLCHAGCTRCGCSSEINRYGESVCFCDACSASGCQYMRDEEECVFSFTESLAFNSM